MSTHAGELGRRQPTDFAHVERYPLTAETHPPAPAPMVIGVNWYTAFDSPEQDPDGAYWIGRDAKQLGTVRGGHCVCLPAAFNVDPDSNWTFYNQGAEGACVGFGCSRMMSLLNRKRYFARWLWDRAKATDEYPETKPGDDDGTSVRAALAVLKAQGHVPWRAKYEPLENNGQFAKRDKLKPNPAEGISAYRWATSMDDVARVLGREGEGYVEIVNSWGRLYPHVVRMPLDTLDRLRREDGEIGVVTDR